MWRTEKAERENMLAAFMMCELMVFRRVVECRGSAF